MSRNDNPIRTELSALIDRVKPDFRGHIPAPAPLKTQQTVEAEKRQREAKNASKDLFRAAISLTRKAPLGYTATRCSKYGVSPPNRSADANQNDFINPARNAYNQVLDESTHRPLIATVLSWSQQKKSPERRRSGIKIISQHPAKMTNDAMNDDFFDGRNVRAVRQDLEALTPRHRAALVRQICLANPKFTIDTRMRRRKEHWDPMSQIPPPPFFPDDPPKDETPKIRDTNGAALRTGRIRLVAALRSRSASTGRPAWH